MSSSFPFDLFGIFNGIRRNNGHDSLLMLKKIIFQTLQWYLPGLEMTSNFSHKNHIPNPSMVSAIICQDSKKHQFFLTKIIFQILQWYLPATILPISEITPYLSPPCRVINQNQYFVGKFQRILWWKDNILPSWTSFL